MANSITASTVSPYSGLLLQDTNFNVSATFPSASLTGSTAAIQFANLNYPTVGQFEVQLYNTALSNSAGGLTVSMSLQDSADGVTFAAIPAFGTTMLGATDSSGTVVAGSITVLLPPTVRTYVRAWVSVPSGAGTSGGITGSFGFNSLF
jgi:hypothetical protein